MEIRIGIVNAPRELSFETSHNPDEITTQIESDLKNGSGLLTLRDDKGHIYLVPTSGIAYIEVGTEESRRIGFVG